MRILFVIETLHAGGAEGFVLRLSQALQEEGHEVNIFAFYVSYYNKPIHLRTAPNVTIVHARIPLNVLLRKVDMVFLKLRLAFSFQNYFIKRSLLKHSTYFYPDVIHSHLFKTDLLCAKNLQIPIVNTIHGDYLNFFEKYKQNKLPILKFTSKLKMITTVVAKIVCISEQQLEFFQNHFSKQTQCKLEKIYNGYPTQQPCRDIYLRKHLNIDPDEFVFGMISRGIPSKGWEIAIDSFLLCNFLSTKLILVGGGAYLDQLRERYKSAENIFFAGETTEPLEWISIFDVGLLPTTYASESLPTVIIEYLISGKPVIASSAGEIPNMLKVDSSPAGLVIPIENNVVNVELFRDAIKMYHDNYVLYAQHQLNTKVAAEEFSMKHCVGKYLRVYGEALNMRR